MGQKLFMALIHALNMLSSMLIPGQKGCTLTTEECSSRKTAIDIFHALIDKYHAAASGTSFSARQEDRLLLHEHKGDEMPTDVLKQILKIWIFSNKRRDMYKKLFDFENYLIKFGESKGLPPFDMKKYDLGLSSYLVRMYSS